MNRKTGVRIAMAIVAIGITACLSGCDALFGLFEPAIGDWRLLSIDGQAVAEMGLTASLTLHADKTFEGSFVGGDGSVPVGIYSGSWNKDGDTYTVTVLESTVTGTPTGVPMPFTISDDGDLMTMIATGGGDYFVQVFIRS